MIVKGKEEYFKGIGKINFEGRDSKNPLAFKYYDKSKMVDGKSMADHFRFAVAYWHSFCGTGADPFGAGTRDMPWNRAGDALQVARAKADAAFEFMTKLGIDFYCFHDFDLVEEADNMSDTESRLHIISQYIKGKQEESGIKLLWGTEQPPIRISK